MLYTLSYGQNKVNVDYEYLRVGNEYHAYSAFINPVKNRNSLELYLVSSFKFDKLKEIFIKDRDNMRPVSFVSANSTTENDDKALHGLDISLDGHKLWKIHFDCETVIVFKFSNKLQIELPFKYCEIKERFKL